LHTRSHGMVRGIFCPLPFLLPTPNIHIFSLFLSGKRCCLAIPTLWTPPVLNGGALSQGTPSPLYVLPRRRPRHWAGKPSQGNLAIRKVEVAVAVSPPVIRSGGISFPWRAPIFSGRYFQPRPRPPRGQPFLPPNLVAWPATPPKVIDLPMATLQERHPILPLGYLRPVKRSSKKAWRPSHLQSFFKLLGLTTATFCLHTALLLWQVFNGTIFSWYAMPVLLLLLAP